MLALTTTGSDDLLGLTEVAEPEPTATEALVRVSTTSLNRGEVARSAAAPAGVQPGWDVVGVVERTSRDQQRQFGVNIKTSTLHVS